MIEARQCYNENVIKSGFSANIVVLPCFPAHCSVPVSYSAACRNSCK